MIAELGRLVLETGREYLDVKYVSGKKNAPALAFLKKISKSEAAVAGGGQVFRIPAREAAVLTFENSLPEEEGSPAQAQAEKLLAPNRAPILIGSQLACDIAMKMRDSRSILAEVQAARPPRTSMAHALSTPTSLEEKIIEIWRSLLGTVSVGVLDDFFELGGDSLLAVQLLSRLQQQFGIDIPLFELFSEDRLTVSRLARFLSHREVAFPACDLEPAPSSVEGKAEL